jgi:hypothetical protein
MKKVTINDVLSWRPCKRYSKERLLKLANGRESMSALEILELDIPADDKLWAVLRKELLPAHILHEFACICAEHALLREREAGREPDPRSWAAIEAKRKWMRREISDEALSEARTKARAAVRAASNTATEAARAAVEAEAAVRVASNTATEAARAAVEAADATAAVWMAADAAAWAATRAAWAAARAAVLAAVWAAEAAEMIEILRKLIVLEAEGSDHGD